MAFVTGSGFTVENGYARSPVSFELTTPTVSVTGNKVIMKGTGKAPLVSGAFSIELAPGDYYMRIGGHLVGTIAVPNDNSTYGYLELMVSDTYAIPSTPMGGAQPNASSTVLGLVKTDVNPGEGEDPIVPLLSTVQALIAGGVTVTNVGGIPTMDFSYTDRIHILLADGYVLEIGANSVGLIQNVLAP